MQEKEIEEFMDKLKDNDHYHHVKLIHSLMGTIRINMKEVIEISKKFNSQTRDVIIIVETYDQLIEFSIQSIEGSVWLKKTEANRHLYNNFTVFKEIVDLYKPDIDSINIKYFNNGERNFSFDKTTKIEEIPDIEDGMILLNNKEKLLFINDKNICDMELTLKN